MKARPLFRDKNNDDKNNDEGREGMIVTCLSKGAKEADSSSHMAYKAIK